MAILKRSAVCKHCHNKFSTLAQDFEMMSVRLPGQLKISGNTCIDVEFLADLCIQI